MSEQDLVDLLRIAVFIVGAMSVGIALVVVVTYAQVYRAHRRAALAGEIAPWRGLLPLHVVEIGVSYLLLVGASIAETALRIGSELSWRAPVYLIANGLGALALWTVLGSTRYRKHSLDTRPTGR